MRSLVKAGPDATIALKSGGQLTEVPLYSAEGVSLMNALRLKQAAEFKAMYEPHWLGMRIIQLPEDIVAMQELLWRLEPDVVVECGVAHGGSLVLHASILELRRKGRVIGVDVEIRSENRANLEAHPLAHRIELIEGSSVDPSVAAQVAKRCRGAERVVVVLDSNHSASHVAAEIRLYEPLVTPGSYLVVMDGAQALVADIPRGDASWSDDNPMVAVRSFLRESNQFEPDPEPERFGLTCVPGGFLRRLEEAERHPRGGAASAVSRRKRLRQQTGRPAGAVQSSE